MFVAINLIELNSFICNPIGIGSDFKSGSARPHTNTQPGNGIRRVD